MGWKPADKIAVGELLIVREALPLLLLMAYVSFIIVCVSEAV